jgi:arginyl-tRNA synthetase
MFHSWWNQGKSKASLRFITEDLSLTQKRMVILRSIKNILSEIMEIFSIDLLEEM